MANPNRYPFTLGEPEEKHDRATRVVHLTFPVEGLPGKSVADVSVPAHRWETPVGRKLVLDELRAQIERELLHDGPP
jgi:hypothetical protein